jgi:hypothetical protein
MKKSLIIAGMFLAFFGFCPLTTLATTLDPNSIVELTTAPNHNLTGYEGSFAIAGSFAVWIDQRDPSGTPAIYGVRLADVTHQEFVIDASIPGCSQLAASGTRVVYDGALPTGECWLRMADITNPTQPRIFEQAMPGPVSYLDTSGPVIAYAGYDSQMGWDTVNIWEISDPNNWRSYSIAILPDGHSVSGLAIDGNHLVWSANYSGLDAYVTVADITDRHIPQLVTKVLPPDTGFERLDVSGTWLVAAGQYSWQRRIFAVRNYTDVENWNIGTLWQEGEGEYYVSGPRLEQPFAVWIVTTRAPSLGGPPKGLDSTNEQRLKAGYLLPDNKFTVSTLRQSSVWLGAAEISQANVVWSEATEPTELFKGVIAPECGDWGYKPGDLNRDCRVDLRDFALIAADWLECTLPNGENCQSSPPTILATPPCDDYIQAWHYDENWNLVGYTFVHNYVVVSYWGTDNVPNHQINSWTVCRFVKYGG